VARDVSPDDSPPDVIDVSVQAVSALGRLRRAAHRTGRHGDGKTS